MFTGFVLIQLNNTGVESLIFVLVYYTYERQHKFVHKKKHTKKHTKKTKKEAVYCLFVNHPAILLMVYL